MRIHARETWPGIAALIIVSGAAGIGDPDANWTYPVIGVDASGQELTRSNRIGEHDYAVDIPSPISLVPFEPFVSLW